MLLNDLFSAQAKYINTSTQASKIYYPNPQSADDHSVDYPTKLINLALNKLDKNYALNPYSISMTQGRALNQLKQEGA